MNYDQWIEKHEDYWYMMNDNPVFIDVHLLSQMRLVINGSHMRVETKDRVRKFITELIAEFGKEEVE